MKLFLLCGLAFAGKSTLARAIADRTGALIVSLDDINLERGLHGGAGLSDRQWALTHRIALTRIERALGRGLSVVVDDTSCFRFLRDNYRSVAHRYGAGTLLIYLEVPFEVALGRLRANASSRRRPPVEEAILLELARTFEPPTADEAAVTFPVDGDVDAWVAQNIAID